MTEPQLVPGISLLKTAGVDGGSGATYAAYAHRKYCPIAPEARLYLLALGEGDDVRFATLFQSAWRQIPQPERREMTRYWESSGLEQIPGILGIDIKLERLKKDFQTGAAASCDPEGRSLSFFAPAVDQMPGDMVQALVAHELAHVVQRARGRSDRPELATLAKNPEWRSLPHWILQAIASSSGASVEREVDALMTKWGFDPDGLRKWIEDSGIGDTGRSPA